MGDDERDRGCHGSPMDANTNSTPLTPRRLAGPAMVAIGAVLALAFPDLRFFWFQGRPLGLLLVVLGALEIAETYVRTRKEPGPRR